MAEESGNPQTSGEGADTGDGRFGRAKDYVNEKYSKASGAVRDGYANVRGKVEDVDMGEVVDQVRSYVRSHPGKALLISVGVGFLVGLLLRRDDDEE